jgi:hypothetical protein
MIVYDIWQGNLDREDIRTEVSRRTAWFVMGEAPADIQAAVDSHDEDYYYKGIPGAISDDDIETTQEADEDAVDHAEDQERLQGTPAWHTRDSWIPNYEDFLQAIERVAHDETDQEAWDIIDNVRMAQLRVTERDAKAI